MTLLELLDCDGRWVKLAAPYVTSKVGPPRYDDVSALARALVSAHPERCLWASHWPHPTRVPPASDAVLLHESAPDAGVRRRILVDNAAQAYDF